LSIEGPFAVLASPQEVKMRAIAFLTIALAVNGLAQTRIDLRSQSKNIDFSQAQSVRPFRTGTSLPPVCTEGEMFFKTDAAPGMNVFGCVATDTWSLQGGALQGATEDAAADFRADINVSGNQLIVSCPTGSCNVQTGDTVASFSGLQTTFVPGSGTYTAYIYFEDNVLRYGYSSGAMTSCPASCVSGVSAFPAGAVPLFTAAVSAGKLQADSIMDRRSRYRAAKRAFAGANIVVSETANAITYSTLTQSPLRNQPAGVQPVCSAAVRGTMWHINGGTGVKDSVTVCAKDSSESYAWRIIY
jgi:hypothetical protein